MKIAIVIKYEKDVSDMLVILTKNGYRVSVEKIGNYWDHKFLIEVSDESSISD